MTRCKLAAELPILPRAHDVNICSSINYKISKQTLEWEKFQRRMPTTRPRRAKINLATKMKKGETWHRPNTIQVKKILATKTKKLVLASTYKGFAPLWPRTHGEYVGPRGAQTSGGRHVDVQAALDREEEGDHTGEEEVEACQGRHQPQPSHVQVASHRCWVAVFVVRGGRGVRLGMGLCVPTFLEAWGGLVLQNRAEHLFENDATAGGTIIGSHVPQGVRRVP